MIREVEIEGFKSIRKLRLECRRINLFIGPPNTGKSNLLESLGMFSLPYDPEKLRAFARCQTMADLFYDQDVESAVRVRADAYTWTLEYEPSGLRLFRITAEIHEYYDSSFRYEYDSDDNFLTGSSFNPEHFPFRFYQFTLWNASLRRSRASSVLPMGRTCSICSFSTGRCGRRSPRSSRHTACAWS
jgi:hypothetical protein